MTIEQIISDVRFIATHSRQECVKRNIDEMLISSVRMLTGKTHAHTKWDKQKIDRITMLAEQGVKQAEIAKEFGVGQTAISSIFKTHGIYVDRYDKRKWTKFQECRIKDMYKKGFTYSEIAKAIGKSKNSCRCKALQMGLQIPGRGNRNHLQKKEIQ